VAIFVLGGLLRSVPRGAEGALWGRFARLRTTVDDPDLPDRSEFWSSWRGAVVLLLAFSCIVVSHQLTPPTLILQTIAIYLVLRPAHPWLPVAFIVLEASWLAQAWSFLTANFRLVEVSLDNAVPPELQTSKALPGFATAIWSAPALMASLLLLTVAGLFSAWRARRVGRVLVPALVAAVPVTIVIAQPYGQEVLFRAYLYALPWAAFIISRHLFFADRAEYRLRRRIGVVGAVGLLATLLLPALYSAELISQVTPSDVVTNAWFERDTADGTLILPLTPGYPLRSTENYDDHLPSDADDTGTLVRLPGFAESSDTASGLVAFTKVVCAARTEGGQQVYLALGPFSENYVRLYGTLPLSRYETFVRRLASEPGFTTVLTEGRSKLIRCG
jgi:hypothetical protein